MTDGMIKAKADGGMVHNLDDAMKMGDVFYKSGMFKDLNSQARCVVQIMAGLELGIGPFAAMAGFHVIQGKVEMASNLIAARIKGSGKYSYRVLKHTRQECEIEFSEGETVVGTSDFSIEEAKDAGLLGNPTWKKYPKNMLFARCISNGAKWHCPDVMSGIPVYHEGEIGGSGEPRAVESRDVSEPPAPGTEEEIYGEPKGKGFSTQKAMNRLSDLLSATGKTPEAMLEYVNKDRHEPAKAINELTTGQIGKVVGMLKRAVEKASKDTQPVEPVKAEEPPAEPVQDEAPGEVIDASYTVDGVHVPNEGHDWIGECPKGDQSTKTSIGGLQHRKLADADKAGVIRAHVVCKGAGVQNLGELTSDQAGALLTELG